MMHVDMEFVEIEIKINLIFLVISSQHKSKVYIKITQK